ncbi:hypothetical protein FRC05_000920 [Tulasnella sp. 425]|nr:hypothetical protein FRC05_000920 [Tulasnella sp. 425]
MISACAACQQHGWVGFKTWVQSCPEGVVQVQTYPFKLNSDTALPGWAFIDTSAGTFDVNQALKVSQNSTGEVSGSPSHTGRLSVGTIVAIVVGAILLIAIPLIYIILRRKPSLNPFRSSASTEAGHTPVRVQPLRMKSIWLGDEHKYSPIQKPNPRTSPVTSIFSPGGALGRLRGSRGGTPIIESGRPTSKFEIDKDTVIEGGAGDEDDPGESSPALGHRQQPSAGGHSNSSWHSILRGRPQVEQHEDIGSAVDFTFVSSNANNNTAANDQQPAEPTSRDPSPEGTGRGPYSWWSRNPPHRYPPIPSARRSTDLSTIYPSDSISNLQLRENLDDQPQQAAEQEQNPVILLRPPQGRNTPSERREAERMELRARQEEEARRELAALELMSPLGSNLQALIDACASSAIPDARISLVISNRKAAFGLVRAQSATPSIPTDYLALAPFLKGPEIPTDEGSTRPRTRADYDLQVARMVVQHGRPDLVVLAGWMHILSPEFLDVLEGKTDVPPPTQPASGPSTETSSSSPTTPARISPAIPIINLHPALPGAFDGANAIQRAYDAFQAGEASKTGVMVHYVVQEVDRGEPIIVKEIEIKQGESLEELEARIHQVEHVAIVEATRKVLEGIS